MTGSRGLRQRGFSLLELLTVITIVGLLAGIAIPNMTSMIRNSKLRGVASDLFGDLLTARSEAVKRNCNVQVVPTGGAWTGGWTVSSVACSAPVAGTIAATQVAAHPALDSDIKVEGTATTIVYGGNGRVSSGAPQTIVFYESTSGTQARCVAVDNSGVPRITLDARTSGTPANGCN